MPQGMTYAQLAPAWADLDAETLSSVTLIDSFQQGALLSITLRFAFSSQEHTLSKEEVQPWVDGIVEKLAKVGASPALLSGFSPAKMGAPVEKVLAFPRIILYDKG